ncbi:DUF4255 domain-containing protein [Fulvivirga sp. RKSG066]|uniref:DUF4255 domain-containing protein n=1 Tax=Fulvivirga aurantia TaxID=2529383 RepID=UPI0012BD748D|nr:DUF4255 domain-containing protein [Fulvivirga aurantia]MTI22451.1 DUF4255 domain-containing protein [Fulvivirga aurantia]
MIYSAVSVISELANDYITNRFGQSEQKIVVSNIVNPDGSMAVTEPDKIILSLVNLQQETVSHKNHSGNTNRPINMNLFLLFSASFNDGNYMEGLRYLSAVISFFQANKVMNHRNTPELNNDIDKLTFEIVNQDLQNQSHLWGTIGGKYLPSILYKVRMVTFQEGVLTSNDVPFSGFGANF